MTQSRSVKQWLTDMKSHTCHTKCLRVADAELERFSVIVYKCDCGEIFFISGADYNRSLWDLEGRAQSTFLSFMQSVDGRVALGVKMSEV